MRLFFPLGRKNEESKRREQSEELLLVGSALCRGRSGAGTRPPPACSLPALRRVSQRGRPRRGRSETFRRSSPHRRRRAARRDRGEVGPAAASPTSSGAPRPAPRRPAQAGGGRQAARRRAEQRPRRSAQRPARPPAGGCGARGAWRQLCRVTRREDCRARARSAPPPTRRPAARTTRPSPPPAALPRREIEALRCERGAPPQRPPQRRAKPRQAPLRGPGRLRFRLGQVASTGPFATLPARRPSRLCRRFRFTRAGAAGPRRGEDGKKAADAEAPRDARAPVTLRSPPSPARLSGTRGAPSPPRGNPRGPAGPLPL